MNKSLKPAFILSILIAVFSFFVSLGGLFLNGLYRDNAFVRATWLGNDAVTLLLGVPILAAALFFAWRGSVKSQLIWMGMLDYMLYNYAFYLFGATFNWFFLLYVILVGLSIFALIFGLSNLDAQNIRNSFSQKVPMRLIGGYFLFVASGLGLIYFAQSIQFILTGQVPSIVTISGHVTNVVFALDLTLLVPWLVLGAVWLMQHKPWGYVIAGMLCVKGPLYTLILAVNTLLVIQRGLADGGELPLWIILTGLGLIASALFYGERQKPQRA